MSLTYQAVGWNRQKGIYDGLLGGGIGLYFAVFLGAGTVLHPTLTIETLLIRALGSAAFILLHLVLSIGPLCRLDARFLPLLYNRRHMGVATFLLGLGHGGFATIRYHGSGDVSPLVSLLSGNRRVDSLSEFPFELLGLSALLVLFLMAATSHDFWLATLTAPVWKGLHMMVYAAYALLVAHVALGVIQAEEGWTLPFLLTVGALWVVGLHVITGLRERRLDRTHDDGNEGNLNGEARFVDVCAVSEIGEGRAHIVCLGGERVAVFRYDGKVSAVSNVCQHQNGPLGEGRILDGCITCPWHGYQYFPETGASPPPFTEKVPTFRVRVERRRVLVDPRPNPPGTRVEPALAAEESA